MKLEHLADGSDDCPLIRLYEFNQAEAQGLKKIVSSLVTGEIESVALQSEPWIETVGGCCLTLRRGRWNQGVRQVGPLNFDCALTPDGWSNVEGLLEPFCESNIKGFQWLTSDGNISLLISTSGQW